MLSVMPSWDTTVNCSPAWTTRRDIISTKQEAYFSVLGLKSFIRGNWRSSIFFTVIHFQRKSGEMLTAHASEAHRFLVLEEVLGGSKSQEVSDSD